MITFKKPFLKKIIPFMIVMILILPSIAFAEEPLLEQSRWSLELKGGTFTPDLTDFSRYYGKSTMPDYSASLAYRIVRLVDIGAEAGWMKIKGQGLAEFHGNVTGSVTYELLPVNIFVLVRGAMTDDQWLVPYVGGGWTRMYYSETVENQDTISGHADGYHVRAGLRLSLDIFDPNASNQMFLNYGVHHTYFLVEAEYMKAVEHSASTNLGGTTYRGGLLFEF
jgi:hypothetical protein